MVFTYLESVRAGLATGKGYEFLSLTTPNVDGDLDAGVVSRQEGNGRRKRKRVDVGDKTEDGNDVEDEDEDEYRGDTSHFFF